MSVSILPKFTLYSQRPIQAEIKRFNRLSKAESLIENETVVHEGLLSERLKIHILGDDPRFYIEIQTLSLSEQEEVGNRGHAGWIKRRSWKPFTIVDRKGKEETVLINVNDAIQRLGRLGLDASDVTIALDEGTLFNLIYNNRAADLMQRWHAVLSDASNSQQIIRRLLEWVNDEILTNEDLHLILRFAYSQGITLAHLRDLDMIKEIYLFIRVYGFTFEERSLKAVKAIHEKFLRKEYSNSDVLNIIRFAKKYNNNFSMATFALEVRKLIPGLNEENARLLFDLSERWNPILPDPSLRTKFLIKLYEWTKNEKLLPKEEDLLLEFISQQSLIMRSMQNLMELKNIFNFAKEYGYIASVPGLMAARDMREKYLAGKYSSEEILSVVQYAKQFECDYEQALYIVQLRKAFPSLSHTKAKGLYRIASQSGFTIDQVKDILRFKEEKGYNSFVDAVKYRRLDLHLPVLV